MRTATFRYETHAKDKYETAKSRRKPGRLTSLVSKPDLGLDLDRGRYLLRNADLRRNRVDRMVVADGGHLAVLVALGLWDMVGTGVARDALEGLLGEGSERRGREGREHVGHGVPRPAQERVVPGVVLAGLCAGRMAQSRRRRCRCGGAGHGGR